MYGLMFILLIIFVIASPIAWLIVECKNVKIIWRLICGFLTIISVFIILINFYGAKDVLRKSMQASNVATIKAANLEISEYLKTSKQKDDPKVKNAIKNLSTLGNISSYINEHDCKIMEKIREDLRSKQNAENKNTKVDKKRPVNLDKKTAIKLAEIILAKIYGEKVLKQRPWLVTDNKTEFKIKGTFHQNSKHSRVGGVAEIVIRKSDAKVLHYIHGK